MSNELLTLGGYLILGYFLVINGTYFVLVALSFAGIRKFKNKKTAYDAKGVFDTSLNPAVSLVVPAYNEESNIVENVRSFMELNFRDFEIIVVNDGSTDETLDTLIQEFGFQEKELYPEEALPCKEIHQTYASETHPGLFLIDKENGKKADANNAGINLAHNELVCVVDADSRLDRDVLLKMLQAVQQDENVAGVGGILRVLNGTEYSEKDGAPIPKLPSGFIPGIQVLEYIRAFLYGRIGWDRINSMMIISGGFGVFRRDALMKVGGYDVDSLGEDFELTVKLHRYFQENDLPYTIRFYPDPVCRTRVPDTWASLSAQRNRWYRGLTGTLLKHKKMIANPSYGAPGMLAMAYFFFIEFLGPVVEMAGYILISYFLFSGNLNEDFAFMFFLIAILSGMLLSVFGLLTDELTHRQYPSKRDGLMLVAYAMVENLGFRQLHTWWRIKGLFDYLSGKTSWDDNGDRLLSDKTISVMHRVWLVVINVVIAGVAWQGLKVIFS